MTVKKLAGHRMNEWEHQRSFVIDVTWMMGKMMCDE